MPFINEQPFPGTAAGSTHQDPFQLFAHGRVPKDLKSLFKWTEYLYYNSAQIYAGVKKFAEYPITEFNYVTDNPRLREQYQKLLENVLGTKRELIRASLDLQVYGNSFTSLHLPFKRYLVCEKCGTRTDIRAVEYKFKLSKLEFSGKCDACGSSTKYTVEDKRIIDPKKVNVIRWDPKDIEIAHNPITNENEYYLQLPENLVTAVNSADSHIISTTPMSVLETISTEKTYKFSKTEIYHMKADAPAGVESGWGYPPLIACMPLFYHASVLRKANESIALDRIVPMRVLHPAATSANGDPIASMSMSNWIDEMKDNLKQWRKDPNHMMFAPVAVGISQVGGDGRALLVDAEIQRAEDNIIAALGFPKEFVYGGLSFTGSSVTLRMLENQLESAVFQLDNMLQWVSDKVGKYLGWEGIEVRLGDFKMVDDVQQKQLMMNLWQGGVVSKTTLAESYGIDLSEERERMKQEQLEDGRLQTDIQNEMEKQQNTLAQQARAEAQMGQQQAAPGVNYDQQQVIAQADQVAMQMMQMDPSSRKSQLSALQAEDYVMYSVVIQRVEQMQLDQKNQAMQQMQGGM